MIFIRNVFIRNAMAMLLLVGFSAACERTAQTQLYVMDCGEIRYQTIDFFGIDNEDTAVREMFVPCYVVHHKGKYILWDAGLPLALVGQGDITPDPESGMILRYDISLIDQLAAINLTPDDIDYLALSHIHFDHAGAANMFTNATWLVQAAEYEAAFNWQGAPILGVQPALLDKLEHTDRLELDGDYDVFGDGVVEIISAPGHTPGHQLLYLDLPKTGRILLSGDLYHFRISRDLKAVPVFNFSRPQTLTAMKKIEALLDERQATLWIEHDAALARSLNKSPAYYE